MLPPKSELEKGNFDMVSFSQKKIDAFLMKTGNQDDPTNMVVISQDQFRSFMTEVVVDIALAVDTFHIAMVERLRGKVQ